MKFSANKSALFEGLQKVQNVVGTRSTLPILANVLIEAGKENISLTTTDLDVTVKTSVQANVGKAGSITLPVRRLSSIVRELPDEEIAIEVDDKNMATVTCGTAYFKVLGIGADDFPEVPEQKDEYGYTISQGTFREMLRKCSYAASSDETRHVLNGVLLSFKQGKLTVVATDGRRLALVEHELDFPAEAETDVILPSKAVMELQHTLGANGDMKVFAKKNQMMFEFGDTFIASKLIDGTYPNYRQVIPAQCEERITVEREMLATALRRVSLVSTDKSSAVKLNFAKNRLTIVMSSPEVGEARDTIAIKYSGKEISVAFNPEYMSDPLKILDHDEIYVELIDDLSPGVIKCDSPFLYVLMPMRIS